MFNGELYNYRELRAELEARGRRFRSASDTEVVLQSLAEWGTAALSRFNGMFAIGWYRSDSRTPVLARIPIGIDRGPPGLRGVQPVTPAPQRSSQAF